MSAAADVGAAAAAAVPAIVVFDLDGCLWWPEMDMTDGPPFSLVAPGVARDRARTAVKLYDGVADILHELHTAPRWAGTAVGYASRTDFPEWAVECLQTITLKDAAHVTMHDVAHHFEIFPGKKTSHFQNIQRRTGARFEDMVFFDNEWRNIRDVSALGVHCVHCEDGMSAEVWSRGIAEFAARRRK